MRYEGKVIGRDIQSDPDIYARAAMTKIELQTNPCPPLRARKIHYTRPSALRVDRPGWGQMPDGGRSHNERKLWWQKSRKS